MKRINIRISNNKLAQMQVSDEDYESFNEVQRPYWREKKRNQRHGLSFEQLINVNSMDVADDTHNPEIILDSNVDIKQKSQQLQKMHKGVKMLTQKQSSAIIRHFFLGMTFVEIAEIEDVDESAIRRRIEAALKKLRKLF